MTNSYSEDILVEQPTIALFETLEWNTVNCYRESFGASGFLGRETSNEVVLTARLAAGAGASQYSAAEEEQTRAVASMQQFNKLYLEA